MYEQGEEIFYYLTLYNEKYQCWPCRKDAAKAFSRGYKVPRFADCRKLKANIFGSGPIVNEALKAQTILAEKYGVSADVWSATNYKWLRNDALNAG